MQTDNDQTTICGFPVSTGDLEANFNTIVESIEKRKGGWVVTLNLEMVYRAGDSDDYQVLLSNADLFIADGVPLVWASRYKKKSEKIKGRSNGTDLVEKLLKSELDYRLGVIGGENPSSVVKEFNTKLYKKGFFYDGIVDLSDEESISKLINILKKQEIDLVLLALGVPKQDQLAFRIRREINSITIIGVGGAFDLLAGQKSRAPKWMQRNGLEWFFRLISEPGRLWRRYLLHYPRAVYQLTKDTFGTFDSKVNNKP